MAKSDFTKMCNPAKLYLAISIVVVIYGMIQQFSLITLGTNFIFSVLWTMVLNWLCSVGLKTISWILVLLPYLMMFLSASFILDMMRGKKQGFFANSTKNHDKQNTVNCGKGYIRRGTSCFMDLYDKYWTTPPLPQGAPCEPSKNNCSQDLKCHKEFKFCVNKSVA